MCWKGGQEKAKDALSPRAQNRHGFTVESLPHSLQTTMQERYGEPRGQYKQDVLEERLHDNCVTPIPDQVSFRIDFPAWMRTRTERDRRIIDDMIRDEGTGALATKYGVSLARISQLRREYLLDWLAFVDEV